MSHPITRDGDFFLGVECNRFELELSDDVEAMLRIAGVHHVAVDCAREHPTVYLSGNGHSLDFVVGITTWPDFWHHAAVQMAERGKRLAQLR